MCKLSSALKNVSFEVARTFTREIEEFLYTPTRTFKRCSFGVPDAKYGELVCAWVQLRVARKLRS